MTMKIARKHLMQVIEVAMERGATHIDYPHYTLYARKIKRGSALTIHWFPRKHKK